MDKTVQQDLQEQLAQQAHKVEMVKLGLRAQRDYVDLWERQVQQEQQVLLELQARTE